MKATSLILLALVATLGEAHDASAQGNTGSIQGVVRSESGAPLEGVNIVVVGTRLGAQTHADGRYQIGLVPAGQQTVRATRIGFGQRDQQVTVPSGGTAPANFDLKSAAVTLDQVVVVGYGTQVKRDVTGSVASVSSNDIATIPVPRVDEAISGMVPGVQVQTTNAQPGSALRIRIRGGNSLSGNNEPLVVVDGVIGADLNQINPSDIESVDVLKDASATSIYGARAANGVILVTTKRGHPGQIRFEYQGYTGMQTVSKHIDLLSADEFARLYMRNPTHDKSITFDTLNALPVSTDWQDAVYRSAPIRSNEIRISGSSGGTSIMTSANLFTQQGIVRNSDFDRGSLRFNLDQEVGKRFHFGTRVTYSRTVGNEVRVNDGYGSAGGPVTMMALRFAPTIPVYDSTGAYSGPLLASQTMDNPAAIVDLRDDKSTTDYLLGNLFGEVELAPGLTARSSIAYTSRDFIEQQYTSRLLRAALNTGQADVNNTGRTTWLAENTLTLRRTLGEKNDITLLGGFTAQETRNNANASRGIGFTSDQLGYNRLNLAETITGTSSSSLERLASVIGRANYSYAGRYLLTATLRADGSSKFAVNNKWAYFPSAAFAWRVSDESFFQRFAPRISDMKLRASVGRTGSEAIGAYQSLASWSVGQPYTIGLTTFRNGATLSRLANPNLRWETTDQTNVGMDLGMFDNRIGITVDAYNKRTHDLLYAKQVPYYTGFDSYITNIGSVQNRGVELSFDSRHNVRAFDVRLGGNIAFNRSKVLDLGGDQEFTLDGVNSSLPRFRPAAIVRVGEPLGNFYGWVWDGIFQDSASAATSGQAGARVGGMKLRDISGPDGVPDGKIDNLDRAILGNAQPKYIFGQTGSVSYNRFTVSYVLRGVQGFMIANLNRQGMETPGGDTNMLPSVLDYWSPTNPTNAMTALGVGPFDGMTSRWLEDGSFVRLQNVTVGWDVPERFTSRIGSGQSRLYLSGQNLHTWTKYSWYDPEVSSRGTNDQELGWDDSSYPGTRTITL
ncbi:MAG: SusC/RagA family TonB-linked outer membrane protein, partial [Gemmatimonadaceae bacterium]